MSTLENGTSGAKRRRAAIPTVRDRRERGLCLVEEMKNDGARQQRHRENGNIVGELTKMRELLAEWTIGRVFIAWIIVPGWDGFSGCAPTAKHHDICSSGLNPRDVDMRLDDRSLDRQRKKPKKDEEHP